MPRTRRRRLGALWIAAAAAMLAPLLTAGPAAAVIDGTDDTAGRFPQVGALQLRAGDAWPVFCSGTLVAEDVVLTAAHCTDFFTAGPGEPGLGPDDLRVTFDLAARDDSTAYAADRIEIHPDWLEAAPGRGNSKMLFLEPGHEDIALVFLKESVSGIAPAPVADAGYLDGLDLADEPFTVAGYGTDEFVTGSAGSAKAVTVFDGIRSLRDVSASPARDAFPDRFVKITKSVCFGDSGGPLFHGDTVVALNAWTFSYRCDGPNLEYRVDSAPAQEFLDAHL